MRTPVLTLSMALICSFYALLPILACAAPNKEQAYVITILKLERNGKPFTNGNPPKGTVRVEQILKGPSLPKQLDVAWKPKFIMGCAVGLTAEAGKRLVKEWEGMPVGDNLLGQESKLSFVEGAKQIAWIYSDAAGKFYIDEQITFTKENLAKYFPATRK